MRREILQGLRRYENCILTLFVVLTNVIVMGVFFDFYYDLNDDTMIKDILSGVSHGLYKELALRNILQEIINNGLMGDFSG